MPELYGTITCAENNPVVEVEILKEYEKVVFHYAVILAKYEDQWILCRHKNRSTLEFPGGRREKDEDILHTAERELYEETGASRFQIRELCAYRVRKLDWSGHAGEVSYGMFYMAEVSELGQLPPFEIEEIQFCSSFPDNWTYPLIQPALLKAALDKGVEGIPVLGGTGKILERETKYGDQADEI